MEQLELTRPSLLRHLGVGLTCILIGCFLNVLVAWVCAIGVNVFNADLEKAMRLSKEGSWEITRFHRFGATCIVSSRSKMSFDEDFMAGQIELLLPAWGDLDVPTAAFRSDKVESEVRFVDARGWPARSLWCELGGVIGIPELGRNGIVQQPVKFAIETPFPAWPYVMWGPKAAPRVLPIRPIRLGFAINTAFYSVVTWITFFGIPSGKRRLRAMRGRCIKCGYDLRGDSSRGCSECGWQRREKDAERPV